MNWLGKIFGGGAKDFADGADKILSRFVESPEEKAKFKLELEGLLQSRDSEIEQTIRTELAAKERVLVAELTQGDNYTKRARPTVVYMGLVFIFLNYCVVPIAQSFAHVDTQAFELPTEFWLSWGGIVSTWIIGRSAEKRGTRNKITSFING